MVEVPDKMFFRIGDVSRISGVKPYVLRYWESEFKFLRPIKNRAGQRVYRRKDVETIIEIKALLYEQKFTIAGARKKIEESKRLRGETAEPSGTDNVMGVLRLVHRELTAINKMLD
jgi:DNA-binding transcriptional MerR regulator